MSFPTKLVFLFVLQLAVFNAWSTDFSLCSESTEIDNARESRELLQRNREPRQHSDYLVSRRQFGTLQFIELTGSKFTQRSLVILPGNATDPQWIAQEFHGKDLDSFRKVLVIEYPHLDLSNEYQPIRSETLARQLIDALSEAQLQFGGKMDIYASSFGGIIYVLAAQLADLENLDFPQNRRLILDAIHESTNLFARLFARCNNQNWPRDIISSNRQIFSDLHLIHNRYDRKERSHRLRKNRHSLDIQVHEMASHHPWENSEENPERFKVIFDILLRE